VLECGKDKGMKVDCGVMEAEGEARGQGVCAEVTPTCTLAGAEAVTWPKGAYSECSASPYLAGA